MITEIDTSVFIVTLQDTRGTTSVLVSPCVSGKIIFMPILCSLNPSLWKFYVLSIASVADWICQCFFRWKFKKKENSPELERLTTTTIVPKPNQTLATVLSHMKTCYKNCVLEVWESTDCWGFLPNMGIMSRKYPAEGLCCTWILTWRLNDTWTLHKKFYCELKSFVLTESSNGKSDITRRWSRCKNTCGWYGHAKVPVWGHQCHWWGPHGWELAPRFWTCPLCVPVSFSQPVLCEKGAEYIYSTQV